MGFASSDVGFLLLNMTPSPELVGWGGRPRHGGSLSCSSTMQAARGCKEAWGQLLMDAHASPPALVMLSESSQKSLMFSSPIC